MGLRKLFKKVADPFEKALSEVGDAIEKSGRELLRPIKKILKKSDKAQGPTQSEEVLKESPPPQIDKEATFAAEKEKKRRLKGRGRASTILSTPESRKLQGSYLLGVRQLLGS